MYCNSCGKKNPAKSNFCKSCGTKIANAHLENGKAENTANQSTKQSKKVKPGLHGWLALVGLGLIFGLLVNVYGVVEYLPLLGDSYNVPGYLALLQAEFLMEIIFTIYITYLLYLYFKMKRNFPKYYTIYLTVVIIYVILDHILLASLVAPTQRQQQIINDALSENLGTIGSSIITSIIWISYMNLSKQVKATFINT